MYKCTAGRCRRFILEGICPSPPVQYFCFRSSSQSFLCFWSFELIVYRDRGLNEIRSTKLHYPGCEGACGGFGYALFWGVCRSTNIVRVYALRTAELNAIYRILPKMGLVRALGVSERTQAIAIMSSKLELRTPSKP